MLDQLKVLMNLECPSAEIVHATQKKVDAEIVLVDRQISKRLRHQGTRPKDRDLRTATGEPLQEGCQAASEQSRPGSHDRTCSSPRMITSSSSSRPLKSIEELYGCEASLGGYNAAELYGNHHCGLHP